MALAVVVGEVMLVNVIVRTAYGDGEPADYPNLAGKANEALARQFSVFGTQYIAPAAGKV
jgi:hypothetical protein